MLTPLSWLKDYVDIDVTPKELEEKLFSCGFEVEESYEVGKDISNVVVGLVEKCEPIPETHLSLCQVNAGAHGTFQICCGADNVKAGGKYPLALIGATVYATAKDHVTIEGVMEIKQGKLRGYDSYGMLCSGVELGLNEDLYPGAGYNGLLVLPEDAKAGDDVKPILGLDDWIFDIAITANRPDCQCIYGMAREVAAVLGKELKEPALDYTADDVKKENFKVSVLAQDICPRYTAHYVHDVKISESPAWMRKRLALVGISSISNVVDITNFILKELGQPMHAFDYSYLEGDEIVVRRANDGEKIVTLDEKEFELNSNNLVICDGKKPVALAGIMGGSLINAMIALTAVTWTKYARLSRSMVLKIKRREFVDAAVVSGGSSAHILWVHILPNILPLMVITAAADIGAMMMELAGLSFLGFGSQPPAPEWGLMLNEGRQQLQTAPWLMFFPGLSIFITVVVFNLWGDSLRDVLDPRNEG